MQSSLELPADTPSATREHLENIADNLQLLADLGYGDVALAAREADGALLVVADARPVTAVAAVGSSRTGTKLQRDREPEAHEVASSGGSVCGTRRRKTRGISYVTHAYAVGPAKKPYAVIIRDLTQQVLEAPGNMERVFMRAAEDLLLAIGRGPIRDVTDGAPFHTSRVAGDGLLRLDASGAVLYASPNAVNIMRLAGVEGSVPGTPATELPGGSLAVSPVVLSQGALEAQVDVGGRVLRYRTLSLPKGALVLVEDVTEAHRQAQELKIKDATIREVHHRVKNNLQTIAALLRIQARRSQSEEAGRALAEAVERVSSMAIVHEMLAGSAEERVDFTEAARTVVDMVRQGLAGEAPSISVIVEGETGVVPGQAATSLALALAELVHNAIEHGFAGKRAGIVQVGLRRLPGELTITVRDDGVGLPADFDTRASAHLGLAIVRTIVEEDLCGTLDFARARGTSVALRVPLAEAEGLTDDRGAATDKSAAAGAVAPGATAGDPEGG